MRRIACALALLTVLLLAPTAAGAWVPSAVYDVPDGGPGACLRPAGVGAVSLFGSAGATTSTNVLLHVGPGAITAGPSTTLGWQLGCAEPSGGADPLLAASLWDGRSAVAAVAPVGDAATRFPPPPDRAEAGPLATAQAGSGAAVVAWYETQPLSGRAVAAFDSMPPKVRVRVVAALRAPGAAAFGAPLALGDWADVPLGMFAAPAVGVDDAGNAVIAWSEGRATRVSSIAAGAGAARAAQRYDGGAPPALAVTPGGRALLATGGGDVLERTSADAPFALVPLLGVGGPGAFDVALRDDGAAVVGRRDDVGVSAWLRPAGGTFGPEQTLQAEELSPEGAGQTISYGYIESSKPRRPQVPSEYDRGRLHVLLAADGRVVTTWIADAGDTGAPAIVLASQGRVDGTMARAERVSSLCMDPLDAYPVELADGRIGVVWSDWLTSPRFGTGGVGAHPPARIHLSLPNDEAAAPAALRLHARYTGPSALRANQATTIRVGCGGSPCTVRVATDFDLGLPAGVDGPSEWSTSSAALPAGATRTLRVTVFVPSNRPRLTPARHPIRVTACDASGAVAAARTLRPALRQLRPMPPPRIRALHARRSGSTVVLTWRTARPARGVTFFSFSPRRTGRFYGSVRGGRRTHYRLVLRHVPRSVHGIALRADTDEGGPHTVVRVAIT